MAFAIFTVVDYHFMMMYYRERQTSECGDIIVKILLTVNEEERFSHIVVSFIFWSSCKIPFLLQKTSIVVHLNSPFFDRKMERKGRKSIIVYSVHIYEDNATYIETLFGWKSYI